MSPTADASTIVRRQRDLVDQSLSMHAVLRDRYRHRAFGLELALLVSSFLLLLVTFLPQAVLASLGVTSDLGHEWSLVLSAVVFFASVLATLLDLRGQATIHDAAAKRLAVLKSVHTLQLAQTATTGAALRTLMGEYQRVFDSIAPIPEKDFLALKAAHKRKVRLSKMLDLYPSVPLPVLRLKLFLADLAGKRFDGSS